MDLILCLTHNCQLRCTYCYSGQKFKQSMSIETARRGIDLAFSEPDRPEAQSRKIAFFGGEPLLEWEVLRESMLYAREKENDPVIPVQFAVTTNGLALTPERLEFLKEQKCFLCFSFDGAKEAQDTCRAFPDGKSSFEATEKVLGEALDFFPDLDLVAVVTPASVELLPRSIDYLFNAGVKNLILNPDFYTDWNEQRLELWRQGYEHAAKVFSEKFRSGQECYINFLTIKILTKIRGGYEEKDMCDFGIHYMAVAPSGNIYPCQRVVADDSDSAIRMGNVESGISTNMRRHFIRCQGNCSPKCEECVLRSRCRNWCSCVNYGVTGDITGTPGIVCFHERMAIEIADRAASALYAEKNPMFMKTFYLEEPQVSDWA